MGFASAGLLHAAQPACAHTQHSRASRDRPSRCVAHCAARPAARALRAAVDATCLQPFAIATTQHNGATQDISTQDTIRTRAASEAATSKSHALRILFAASEIPAHELFALLFALLHAHHMISFLLSFLLAQRTRRRRSSRTPRTARTDGAPRPTSPSRSSTPPSPSPSASRPPSPPSPLTPPSLVDHRPHRYHRRHRRHHHRHHPHFAPVRGARHRGGARVQPRGAPRPGPIRRLGATGPRGGHGAFQRDLRSH